MRIHLLRHGRCDGADGRCVGRTDVVLAPDGRAAFERIAARWPHGRPARLVASDRTRALASAAPLAAAWGLPVEQDARLRELDFGRWEGRAWAEIEAEEPEALTAWMADWTRTAPPGGESFADLRARIGEAFEGLRGEDGDVVVVAHAGPIRAALVGLLGLDPAHAFRLEVAHAALTTARLEPPVLLALNQTL